MKKFQKGVMQFKPHLLHMLIDEKTKSIATIDF